MRIDPADLRHVALLALEDAMDRSRHGPVERTFGIRLALAYLASTADCERWPFDEFWRWMVHADLKGRTAHMTGSLNGIYRQLGVRPKTRGR